MKKKKKRFLIACDWMESGEMYVEADTLEEAIEKAEESDEIPDGTYIDGSFQVNREITEVLDSIEKAEESSEEHNPNR